MNTKNVRKWIKALRSKNYEQGQSKLIIISEDGNYSFCFLGVACDLYDKIEGMCSKTKKKILDGHYDADCEGYMPKSVVNWLKLTMDERNELVGMNDIYNKSFKQIAAYLEKKLENQNKRKGKISKSRGNKGKSVKTSLTGTTNH